MIRQEFPNKLKLVLKESLPGTDIQWEMASSDRKVTDFPRKRNPDSQLASVLILLYPSKEKIYTVFMQRPEYKGAHSGQVSFPGGKMEAEDKDLVETALREACEETGVCNKAIEVLGKLTPLYIPVSDIEVTPVVAYLNARPQFKPDRTEVVKLFEAPLEIFKNASSVKEKTMQIEEASILVKYYDCRGNIIWGATAMILHELLVILRDNNLL